MIILLAAAAAFSIGTWSDPIIQEEWLTFEVVDGSSRLGLYCKPRSAYLEMRVYPEGYQGPSRALGATKPSAVSRFPQAPEPLALGWIFEDTFLSFYSGGELKTKARVMDELARDDTFVFRWWDGSSQGQTVTIQYELDHAEMRSFMAQCGPKKVNRYLKEMGSPAAP